MLPKNLWCDLVGLQYENHARGPDKFDCLGLVVEIYKRMGITIFDPIYSDDRDEQTNLLDENSKKWMPTEIKPGACLLFRRSLDNKAAHVGVSIDADRFIHATEDQKQVIISKLSSGYIKKLIGAYEYAV